MKRHPALVPLSHDHHHGLVEARRLRAAADAPVAERVAAAQAFVAFFAAETARHFREEEEQLFPLVGLPPRRPDALLAEILLDHAALRALVGRLEEHADPAAMRETADLLEAHIRREERELFPLIERAVSEDELESLELGHA